MDSLARRPREYRERINFWLFDGDFRERFRFSCAEVEEMLRDIGPLFENKKIFWYGIEPHHRLLLALRFYATGDFCYSVGDCHGISKSAVHCSVYRVTQIINDKYFKEVISWPSSEQARTRIACDFFSKNRFPAACGAINGTLIKILAPSENEWQFVDRKGNHSLNVMAVACPNYKFVAVNANWPGSVHDARLLRESKLFRRLSNGWRPFPNAVLLGDSAYPLLNFLMTAVLKPEDQISASERRFNFSLRKSRFVVENAFGILKSRFRCLDFIRVHDPKKASLIINACFILHNILMSSRHKTYELPDDDEYAPEEVIAEESGSSTYPRRMGLLRRNNIIATFSEQQSQHP